MRAAILACLVVMNTRGPRYGSRPELTTSRRCDTLARMAKPALGRGLGALLGESPIAAPFAGAPPSIVLPAAGPMNDSGQRVQRVAIHRIQPCPFQPRKDFP